MLGQCGRAASLAGSVSVKHCKASVKQFEFC